MRLCTLALVCSLLLPPLAQAADLQHSTPSFPAIESVQVQQDAKDPSTIELIDHMNAYRMQVELANSLEALQDHYNNRVRWEMHLGVSQAFAPAPGGPLQGLPDYHGGGSYQAFNLGLKANLNNLKLPRPEYLLGEISRLRALLGIHKYESTDTMIADCDRMEAGTKAYLDQFWFKRWSLGVNFPFLYRSRDGSSQSSTYDFSGGYSYSSSTSNYNTGPDFDWTNSSLVLDTDLGDFITLEAGYSMQNHLSVGVSMDVSTPVSAVTLDFFDFLRSLSGSPMGTNYPHAQSY